MSAKTRAWKGAPFIRSVPVWQKLLLAGLLLLVPFLLGVGYYSRTWYVQTSREGSKAVAGATVVVHCDQLLADLQPLRTTAVALASGDNRLANEVGQQEAKAIEQDIDSIDTQDAANLSVLGLTPRWRDLKDLLTVMLRATERMHAEEVVTRYEEATSKISDFITAVSEQADLDYVGDASLSACMQMSQCSEDAMRRFGVASELISSRGALRQNLNMDDMTELVRLMTLMDHDEDQTDKLYRKLTGRAPALKSSLEEAFTGYKSACDGFIDYIQNTVLTNGGALPRTVHGRLLGALAGITTFSKTLLPAVSGLAQDRQLRTQRDIYRIVAVTGTTTCVVLFLYLFIAHEISAPLSEVDRVLRGLSEGRLSMEIPLVQRGDEFGPLNANLNKLLHKLRTVRDTIRALSESTGQLVRHAYNQTGSLTQLGTAINEASTAMGLTQQASQSLNSASHHVAGKLRQAKGALQGGVQTMEQTLLATQQLIDRNEAMSTDVLHLNEHARVLGDSADAVRRVVDQAHSLASGQQRTTAYAGNEMRMLGDELNQIAGRLAVNISDIQRSCNTVMMLSLEESKTMRELLRQSGDAGGAIRALLTDMNEAEQAATRMAASAQQQASELELLEGSVGAARSGGDAAVQRMQTMQAHVTHLQQAIQDLDAWLGWTQGAASATGSEVRSTASQPL